MLIVDDSEPLRAVLREWLRRWRFHVEEADDGAVALERAKACRPALIIMDYTMAGLDGIRATEQIKRDPATESIPVLMLSAEVGRDIIARALAAGCDAFVGKPIPAAELLERIREVFRRTATRRSA